MKYVSFSCAEADVMCSPLIQTRARPSHPLLPYAALQTSMLPFFGLHDRGVTAPVTTDTSKSNDWSQSPAAVPRYGAHTLLTLSPSPRTTSARLVRFQW